MPNKFCNAIKQKNLPALKTLLNELNKPLSAKDNLAICSGMHEAMTQGCTSSEYDNFYQLCIESKVSAAIIDTQDALNYLHFAIQKNNVSFIKWALKTADISLALTTQCNIKGKLLTPLEHAKLLDCKNIIALLDGSHVPALVKALNNSNEPEEFLKLIRLGCNDDNYQLELIESFQYISTTKKWSQLKWFVEKTQLSLNHNFNGKLNNLLHWIIGKEEETLFNIAMTMPGIEDAIHVIVGNSTPLDLAFIHLPIAVPILKKLGAELNCGRASSNKVIDKPFLTTNNNRYILLINEDQESIFDEFLMEMAENAGRLNRKDLESEGAIHYCIEHGKHSYLKKLINTRNTLKRTENNIPFLHLAIQLENTEALKLLLQANDAEDYVNSLYQHQTPSDYALKTKTPLDYLQELQKHECLFTQPVESQPEKKYHHQPITPSKSSVIPILIRNNQIPALKKLLHDPSIQKELNQVDANGLTPAQTAVLENNDEALALLTNHDVDPLPAIAIVGDPFLKRLRLPNDAAQLKSIIQRLEMDKTILAAASANFFKTLVMDSHHFSKNTLEQLAKYPKFKERLFNFIETLSVDDQLILLKQSLKKDNSLNIIWHTKRGRYQPHPNRGHLGKALKQILDIETAKFKSESASTTPQSLPPMLLPNQTIASAPMLFAHQHPIHPIMEKKVIPAHITKHTSKMTLFTPAPEQHVEKAEVKTHLSREKDQPEAITPQKMVMVVR